MAISRYTWKNDDKPTQTKALGATVAVQVVLLLLLLLNGFVTPLPLPGEKGIAISFGNEKGGLGAAPRAPAPQPAAPPQPKAAAPQQENSQLSQDFEDAPAIVEKTKPRPPAAQPKEKHTAPAPTPQRTKKEPERQVDKAALFPGAPQSKNGNGAGDGGSPGNQGAPDALYTGKPGGQGGNGLSGSGKGSGAAGNGISYSLNGRIAMQLPQPEYPKQRGGRVVVKVWVNRNGKVVQAEPGEPGSTTFDQSLLEAAKRAALQAQFDLATDAPDVQTGTITYVFHLKQ